MLRQHSQLQSRDLRATSLSTDSSLLDLQFDTGTLIRVANPMPTRSNAGEVPDLSCLFSKEEHVTAPPWTSPGCIEGCTAYAPIAPQKAAICSTAWGLRSLQQRDGRVSIQVNKKHY